MVPGAFGRPRDYLAGRPGPGKRLDEHLREAARPALWPAGSGAWVPVGGSGAWVPVGGSGAWVPVAGFGTWVLAGRFGAWVLAGGRCALARLGLCVGAHARCRVLTGAGLALLTGVRIGVSTGVGWYVSARAGRQVPGGVHCSPGLVVVGRGRVGDAAQADRFGVRQLPGFRCSWAARGLGWQHGHWSSRNHRCRGVGGARHGRCETWAVRDMGGARYRRWVRSRCGTRSRGSRWRRARYGCGALGSAGWCLRLDRSMMRVVPGGCDIFRNQRRRPEPRAAGDLGRKKGNALKSRSVES
jgi:hypothetical protein